MKGAIFYYSKYGSTKQYADWIAEATGLPMFDVKSRNVDLTNCDYLIIGSPILYFKLSIHKWVKRHLRHIERKPIICFSVSGAPAGKKLDGWIADSLPEKIISKMNHIALRGRQIPEKLTLYDKIMVRIGALFNKDPEARKQEIKGFDFMDKTSIDPLLKLVHQFQSR